MDRTLPRHPNTGVVHGKLSASMNRARLVPLLLREFGTGFVMFRAGYAALLKCGYLRWKLPIKAWTDTCLDDYLDAPGSLQQEDFLASLKFEPRNFFFDCFDHKKDRSIFNQWDQLGKTPVSSCEELRRGKLVFFGNGYNLDTGFPPRWFRNAFTGRVLHCDKHWTEISDCGVGDIKVIWEPSRFSFSYDLVRSYWRTGDKRYPELFWQAVEDWYLHNPPQAGPNWKCGQEISLRVMAWLFGLFGFLESESTTEERFRKMAHMLAVSGERIEKNISYALRQQNNHGISETMGLWTLGLLFPEMKRAKQWRRLGKKHLESQCESLVYDDGSFSQHSLNYHRVMLHDYIWAIRLGDLNDCPLSDRLKERFALAVSFLRQVVDDTSGETPNYGQNDGALVLPLTNCDYPDMRPVIQAAWYLTHERRCFPEGPWDEELIWLFGTDALEAAVQTKTPTDLVAPEGGYYTLHSDSGFVFTRCGRFKHRPGQADMLHVDLWWKGQNIAVDPGTFSYNAPSPWNNPLAHTAYHNTVTVDGRDQMERVGRFIWLPWVKGWVTGLLSSQQKTLSYWEGQHDGYETRDVMYRRGILRLDDVGWLVLDRLSGHKSHNFRLHWLLNDFAYQQNTTDRRIVLQTPKGNYHVHMGAFPDNATMNVVRASTDSPRGWQATYGSRKPAISVGLEFSGREVLFWSFFSESNYEVTLDKDTLMIAGKTWVFRGTLSDDTPQLITSAVFETEGLVDTISM
jgi:asparagine synthase (glutamine-hydrolysing)